MTLRSHFDALSRLLGHPNNGPSSVPELLGRVSACRDLYALVVAASLDREYGPRARIAETARQLGNRLAAHLTGDHTPAERLEIGIALFDSYNTCGDEPLLARALDSAAQLTDEYNGKAGEEAAVCKLLCLYCYYVRDETRRARAQQLLRSWAAAQSPDGTWKDAPIHTALERLHAMHMYSYLLLDDTFDQAVASGTTSYAERLPLPETVPDGVTAKMQLPHALFWLLASVADDPAGSEKMARIAACTAVCLRRLKPGSDAWFRCAAVIIYAGSEERIREANAGFPPA